MKKIVIGIDVGISTTKIVGIDASGMVISPIRIKATDPITSLYGAFGKYLHDNRIALDEVEHVMLTGVGAAYIDERIYGLPTSKSEEFVADFDLNVLHIIGGGSLNQYLNQFTANSCGVTVLAGPQEGTAIGNIMLQAKASGLVKDIWEMRQIIANSLELKKFEPQNKEAWNEAYEKFLKVKG